MQYGTDYFKNYNYLSTTETMNRKKLDQLMNSEVIINMKLLGL